MNAIEGRLTVDWEGGPTRIGRRDGWNDDNYIKRVMMLSNTNIG